MVELIEEIEKLCSQTSFRGNDIERIKTLYGKYINNRDRFCSHCPGSVNKMIKTFQGHKDIMISKVIIEFTPLKKEEDDEEETNN